MTLERHSTVIWFFCLFVLFFSPKIMADPLGPALDTPLLWVGVQSANSIFSALFRVEPRHYLEQRTENSQSWLSGFNHCQCACREHLKGRRFAKHHACFISIYLLLVFLLFQSRPYLIQTRPFFPARVQLGSREDPPVGAAGQWGGEGGGRRILFLTATSQNQRNRVIFLFFLQQDLLFGTKEWTKWCFSKQGFK